MTTPARDAKLDGDVALTTRQLEVLEARVDGPPPRASGEGWDDALLVWNGMVARIPRSSSSRPPPTTSLRRSGTGKG